MDLFDDLPEPSNSNFNSASDTSEKTQICKSAIDKEGNSSEKCQVYNNYSQCDRKRKFLEDDGSPCTKKPTHGVMFKGFVAERQGEREEMQDAHVLMDDWGAGFTSLDPSIRHLSLYAVMDGHGGKRASRFASENLPINLREKFPKGDISKVQSEIKKCFIDAYKKTDEDFLKEATKNKPPWRDGTTAVSALFVNDTVYIANLGDSKAVLCRYNEEDGKYQGIPLSQDHSPSAYDERLRIQKAGGHVRDGRVMGVLEVSRSIGDGQYKTFGVSCLPDVKKCQLRDNDRFLLIGCDGLWKSFTVQESIEFIQHQLNNGKSDAKSGDHLPDTEYESACNKLVSEAVLRLSADNVTVILVRILKNSCQTGCLSKLKH